jgi:hypothetical protein
MLLKSVLPSAEWACYQGGLTSFAALDPQPCIALLGWGFVYLLQAVTGLFHLPFMRVSSQMDVVQS